MQRRLQPVPDKAGARMKTGSHPRPRSSSAFTLIEILVTVVILSVGIVAVLSAFNQAVAALGASSEALAADRLITERMDALREAALEAGDPLGRRSSGTLSLPAGVYRWEAELTLLKELPEIRRDDEPLKEAVYEARVSVRREGSDSEHAAATYLRAAGAR